MHPDPSGRKEGVHVSGEIILHVGRALWEEAGRSAGAALAAGCVGAGLLFIVGFIRRWRWMADDSGRGE